MQAQPIEEEPASSEGPALRLCARMPPADDVNQRPLRQVRRMEDDTGPALGRLGVYRIEAALGQGGMGEVFLAWDERLSRHAAIKRIRSDKPLDEVHHARFRREARAVARLSHPAIVQVYDVFEDDDGSDCIVMEHVEGKSLAELVARRAVDLELALRLAGEIADGLAEAHTKGLIHRDLKAENVMVTSSGHAKILDFGLARALWPAAAGEDDARLSDSGALVGTVHAMSPEQAGGQPVDHRSDLFALGSLLYEMLTGRAPFRGSNLLDSLRRVLSVDVEPLSALRPELPPELGDLVGRLLAKEPGQRPQNARLVADEIELLRARVAFRAEAQRRSSPTAPEAAENLESLPTLAGAPGPSDLDAYRAASDGSAIVRTLVMTDLVRSTQLIESLGDERAFELAGRHDRTARDLLKRFGGLEIDKSDGFLLLFERPADAVAYAFAYHRSLERLSKEEGVELTARVGIHLGEVRLRHNPRDDVSRGAKPLEVEGIAKPTAARVMSLAGPRQTLLTRTAFDLARRVDAAGELAETQLSWLAHGSYVFQGVEEPLEVFEVGREGFSPLAEPEDTEKTRRMVSIQEELVLGWRPAAGQGIPRRKSWVLLEKIGQGGFGEVWLARHKSGEKRVFKFCFQADRLRGLKREVTLFRLLKEALGHREDIARILDWNFEMAPFYLEAEYTEGGNLAEWTQQQGGAARVPLETRLGLVADVAEALAAAHSVGILHKDVKPENVLVNRDREGRPRAQLTDFGIGLLTDRERLESGGVTVMGFTATASTLGSSEGGTLGYMAPEVMQGRPATVQADVYSLGVMLYQVVVGDFGRALATGWERDVEDELLAEEIASCVDGVAERRPASALVVAERLRHLEERRAEREAERRAGEELEASRQALQRAQRRRRVFAAIAAVAVVVLAVVTALAGQAIKASRQADLRRGQAEALIDFMLGDLRNKLKPIGRLDILDEVGDEALAYFDSIPREELSIDELSSLSRALTQIGELRWFQGRLDDALETFEKALALTQELVARNPSKLAWQKSLGETHYWVGFVSWRRGAVDDALKSFETFLAIAEHLVEEDPENPEWQLELMFAHNNIGFVLEANSDLEGALAEYSICLSIVEDLLAQTPGDKGLLLELATSHNTIGHALEAQGKLREALDHYQMELTTRTSLAERDSADTSAQKRLASAHVFVGRVLEALGELDRSMGHLLKSLEILERLTAIDPNRLSWQRDLAVNQSRIGRILLRTGEVTESRAKLQVATDLLKSVSSAVPSDVGWQRDLAKARCLLGRALLMSGNLEAATQEARSILGIADTILETNPDDRDARLLKSLGFTLLGEILSEQGDGTRARSAWVEALHAIEPKARRSTEARFLGPWARVLNHLGRTNEALDIVEKLTALGYRYFDDP